ncbi:Protein of uncharacterised function (DUF551) [Yersinia frederiksenii]|nr:Protein of uncharacterised function (DUF551) [Yersinia frederiksenii]
MKELDRFTSERLESLCDYRPNRVTNLINFREIAALARIALAAKRAEPVAYGTLQKEFCDEERSLFTDKDSASKYSESCYDLTPLYITPHLNSPEIPEGWIKCSDRMPEDSGRYWCYVEEQNCLGKSHYQWNCSWSGDVWSDRALTGRVTHWMPLPAAPEKENG